MSYSPKTYVKDQNSFKLKSIFLEKNERGDLEVLPISGETVA